MIHDDNVTAKLNFFSIKKNKYFRAADQGLRLEFSLSSH